MNKAELQGGQGKVDSRTNKAVALEIDYGKSIIADRGCVDVAIVGMEADVWLGWSITPFAAERLPACFFSFGNTTERGEHHGECNDRGLHVV